MRVKRTSRGHYARLRLSSKTKLLHQENSLHTTLAITYRTAGTRTAFIASRFRLSSPASSTFKRRATYVLLRTLALPQRYSHMSWLLSKAEINHSKTNITVIATRNTTSIRSALVGRTGNRRSGGQYPTTALHDLVVLTRRF